MWNTGSIFFTAKTPAPAGAPTVTGANNGVSLFGADVVLGNDQGDAAAPAALISNREIVMGGFIWQLLQTIAGVIAATLSQSEIGFVDGLTYAPLNAQGGYRSDRFGAGVGGSVTGTLIQAGVSSNSALFEITNKNTNQPTLAFLVFGSPVIRDAYIRNNNGVLEFFEGNAFALRMSIDMTTGNVLLNTVLGNTLIGNATDIGGRLQLAAGSATTGSAPIKLRSGAVNTVPQVGAIEFLTDRMSLVITTGAVREQFAFLSDIPTVPTLTSGTYTPTLTNGANVTASTPSPCSYMRVGNIVTVYGMLQVTQTLANLAVELGISLPIASNFAATTDLNGNGINNDAAVGNFLFNILADVANDRASLNTSGVGGALTVLTAWFSFQYEVL